MNETPLYAIDKDYCPENDQILVKNQCSGCEHYKGFQMYLGQPCVACSYYEDIQKEK